MNKESIAIIIPMYNEEKVAARCIDKVVNVLQDIHIPAAIIAINDGSSDNTQELLEQKKKQYRKYVEVVGHKRNRGYGAATSTGIKTAIKLGFTWALHMDSDLTNDPKDIKRFVSYIPKGYDCVKASRYVKGGKVVNVSFFRRFISYIGNIVASFLFGVGIKDCTNGFRMVRLSKLKGITLRENNFSIILEELYYLKKRKSTFGEMPITLSARINSASHFRYNARIFYDYFKYVILSAMIF